MKRPAQTVCGILVLFLAFLTVSTGQAKIISQVPDTQQPVTGSIGNPVNNACAPVSAVNITQFWDVVRAHPNAFHVNAALIPNTAADYLYYFMDTNNWGSPVRMNGTVYPASSGTYSSDIMPGMHDFVRWDVLNPFTTPPPALPANKVGYDWTYNADFSDLGNIGFNFHTAAIDTGRPDIICFRYWNPVNSGTFVIDPTTGDTIRFFTWGPQVSGSTPPNPIEQWNLYYGQECVGHAVTGVGYYRNYDPDGGGPLPNTNWFICHDNWSTTPKNVALPWANWAATITADPGIVQIPVISVVPDSIFHSQLINTTVTYNNDFSISNTGTGALTYTATNVLPWVTFAGISGNIPAGGSDAINVTVNTTARPTGIYYDTLTILSNDPINPVIHIPEIFIQVTLPQIEPCTFYKAPYTDYSPNGMPDFDQKQGGWWNPGSGNFSWCGPVALANCIWWFDSKFEPNPIDPRPFFPGGNPPPNDNYGLLHSFGIWDDHDTNNVVPFISTLGPMCGVDVGGAGTALPNLQMGFISWMASVGMGGAYNANIVMGPGYPEIRDSVFSSQDVILLLGFYEILPSQDCQRLGGHYVTCAGACAQEPYLCISDPFFDKNEGEPPPGTAHGSTIHNDAFFVSGPHGTINHDRFHMAMIGTPTPCGPGLWGLTDYPNRWTQDGLFTFANENAISPGQPMGVYQGGQIVVMVDAALIICPIPMIPDINVLPDTLFYQQYSHTAQTYINQIIICNNGTAPLNISSITSDHGWITAGSFLSPLAAGQCDTIDITINAVGVVPGIYTGHFHVASDDPDTPVLNKPSYTVRIIEPDITVTLDSVFHAQLFNSVVVYPNDFSIASTGSAPLNYNLINTLPWVAYFGLTGLIPPGGVDHITTRVNTAGIAPGIYIDNITINSDDPDTPVLHKPKMVIQVVAPDIAVLPDSIYHSQPINNLVTYNADFMVRNNGTSILHYNMVSPLTWVTLAGGLGFIPPGGQDLINVTVNTNGVSVGTYTDIITINSDDPDTPILNKPKIVINVIPAEILPCDFYKAPYPDYAPNGMPDFDQKQGGWWNPGSG
ncbi:MAG TPA: hypothetical protein DEO84_00315, partial [candidate division Zixibacteria bacterium]|nr:hypothetical protein [candidate division Zixibacteria bacterium]